jgi:hypothetical protein
MKTNCFRKNASVKAGAHVRRFLGKLGMTALLLWPVVCVAQNGVTVSNLNVNGGTVTFNVSWDENSDELKSIVWSDSVWVFVDYNAGGVMKRLPLLPDATLTETSAPEVAHVIQYSNNDQGVWVVGNARSAGSFSATVKLLTATADVSGACAYASNYPPVGDYPLINGKITFTGTPMYKIVLEETASGNTYTAYSDGTYTIHAGETVKSFTDATGAPGIIKCIPSATYTLTASASGFCEGDAEGVTFALDGTEAGRKYRLYRDGIAVSGEITGGGSGFSFGAFAVAGAYSALTVAEGPYCATQMGGALSVAQNPLPAPPQLNDPADVCESEGTIVFVASDYSGEVDWSQSTGGSAEGNSYTYTSSEPGAKSVTVRSAQTYTDAPTCYSTNSVSRSAEVYANPAVPNLTVQDQLYNTPATFTASGSAGTYEWNGYFDGLYGPIQYTDAAAGTYTAAVRSVLQYATILCESLYSDSLSACVLDSPYVPCASSAACASGFACSSSMCVESGFTYFDPYSYRNSLEEVPCPDGYEKVTSCDATATGNNIQWLYLKTCYDTYQLVFSCQGNSGPVYPESGACTERETKYALCIKKIK